MPRLPGRATVTTVDTPDPSKTRTKRAAPEPVGEEVSPVEGRGEPIEIEDEVISPLSEDDDYLRGLWYGAQGSGKTTNLCRVLLHEPVGDLLICNAEGGAKIRALRKHGIPVDRIKVWPKPGVRPTFDGLERLVFQVDNDLRRARREGRPKPYCAFDLDSITELIKLMLDNVLDDGQTSAREIDRKAREAGVAPPRRNARKRFQTERDDYQLVSQQMRSILRRLRYMDLHFLVTALVRRDEDPDTGAVMYGPAMPPALQSDLLGYMDVVIRTEVRVDENGKEEWIGHTRPDENHQGKDRYGMLPAELIDPGADVVLGHIMGPVVDSDDPQETGPAAVEAEPAEPPKRKPATRTRKKTEPVAPSGDEATVGAKDGSDDEPPF